MMAPLRFSLFLLLSAFSSQAFSQLSNQNALSTEPTIFPGPVIASNFPDPGWILPANSSTYYAFATNNLAQGINIPVATSEDFVTWTLEEGYDALPDPGSWTAYTRIWAPDVVQLVHSPNFNFQTLISN
jgi:hypothetical protein